MQELWEPGRMVISTAGRDIGYLYIILSRIDQKQVLVVDGKSRKVVRPKRKNIKHLKACPEKSGEISEKLISGIKVTDLDVQRAIKELSAQYQLLDIKRQETAEIPL